MFAKDVMVFCVAGCLSAGAVCAGDGEWGEREPLAAVAARYGFEGVVYDGETAALRSAWSRLVFYVNSRRLEYNNLLFWLNGPLLVHDGEASVSQADAHTVIDPLLRAAAVTRAHPIRTVVLDPGHGGADSGAIGRRRVYEKKAVLDIAKRVRRKLQASGVRALLTRTHDRSLGLAERTARARRWEADAFISIHLNASSNPLASGVETFVLPAPGFPATAGGNGDPRSLPGNRYDRSSLVLAAHVHRGLAAAAEGPDRGIKRARFQVLREAPCAAVLVECGFLSNIAEEARIIDPAYRDRIAEGIARGVLTCVSLAAQAE